MSTEPSLSELGTVFASLHEMFLSAQDAASAVQQLARAARRMIPTAAGAGVSLFDEDGTRVTTASTDDLAEVADELQYSMGQGPCLSAWATGETQRVDDTTQDTRWTGWQEAAARHGIRSVLSTPLTHRQRHLGAMKVYATDPGAFDETDEQLAVLLADVAATLIAAGQTEDAPTRLSESLKTAMRSREAIAQATGVMVARDGLSPEAAQSALLDRARRQGRRVTDVAAEILDGVQVDAQDRTR